MATLHRQHTLLQHSHLLHTEPILCTSPGLLEVLGTTGLALHHLIIEDHHLIIEVHLLIIEDHHLIIEDHHQITVVLLMITMREDLQIIEDHQTIDVLVITGPNLITEDPKIAEVLQIIEGPHQIATGLITMGTEEGALVLIPGAVVLSLEEGQEVLPLTEALLTAGLLAPGEEGGVGADISQDRQGKGLAQLYK